MLTFFADVDHVRHLTGTGETGIVLLTDDRRPLVPVEAHTVRGLVVRTVAMIDMGQVRPTEGHLLCRENLVSLPTSPLAQPRASPRHAPAPAEAARIDHDLNHPSHDLLHPQPPQTMYLPEP